MFARFEQEGVNIQTPMPGLRMGLKNLALPSDELKEKMEDLGVATGIPSRGSDIFALFLGGQLDNAEETFLATSVFGGRAFADMKAAIEEGRFEFEDLIKGMRTGKGSIREPNAPPATSTRMEAVHQSAKTAVEPAAPSVRVPRRRDAQLNQLMKGPDSISISIGGVVDALAEFWEQAPVVRRRFGRWWRWPRTPGPD